jgi:enoyl-CoA hydratase/carnithine racemase
MPLTGMPPMHSLPRLSPSKKTAQLAMPSKHPDALSVDAPVGPTRLLTGRPVPAGEAFTMGLAHELAALPPMRLRNDRLSVYEQFPLSLTAPIENESSHGMKALAAGEAREGAARCAAGEGRGGQPARA